MSRLAKKPLEIPKGVELKLQDNKAVAKGPLGELFLDLKKGINLKIEKSQVDILNEGVNGAEYGLYWALLRNILIGVSKGYEKKLVMIGVGYRAQVSGNMLNVQVGFSHPTNIEIPKNLKVKVEKMTNIIISGNNKQEVGQFAAKVRDLRSPEPYKGKGIRYENEYVRKKAGKAAKGKG